MAVTRDRKSWTMQEDERLLELRGEGRYFKDIAAELGRSTGSCEMRHKILRDRAATNGSEPPPQEMATADPAYEPSPWPDDVIAFDRIHRVAYSAERDLRALSAEERRLVLRWLELKFPVELD